MKTNDSDQVLSQVLGGQEIEDLRRATLEFGLSALRQRRARRRAGQVAALVCLLLIPMGMLFQSVAVRRDSAGARTQAAAVSDGGVKLISDEELFALFPDRPLALVGKPGHQQLVFLDQPYNPEAPVTR